MFYTKSSTVLAVRAVRRIPPACCSSMSSHLAANRGGWSVAPKPGLLAVDSKKLEYVSETIEADSLSSLGFGAGGQSYSKFLASSVVWFGRLDGSHICL